MDEHVTLTALGAASLILILWRIALVQQRRARSASARGSGEVTITWLGTYSAAFQRALDICQALELELIEADPNHGLIVARTGLGALATGPTLRIALRTQEGITTLTLNAGASLVELGQSGRLAKRFVEIWDRMPDPISD